ncbi:hypothetical protein [Pannonibacter sp. SL95]|uniref:hypothetical protein n=1 Tax=Pannonibacter sp. SL95 TaxID=2995153 RepID=UPI0022765C76|nr:hypothetical protein [Pannonibacter sp. SL95]MCY1704473.1 hypothetical protein [Pannonibacter sp. SL95]MCY1707698.1 hypothetical protein [Pannonibacter sp. SL95]MCY1707741.1 hypothetical protein [Pannonibacter sp. SL95]
MITIDHILHYSGPDAVDLAALGLVNEGQPVTLADLSIRPQSGTFDGAQITAVRVTVYAQDATFDDEGYELTPQIIVPGVWLAVRADHLLTGLPELVAAADADLARQGLPYVVYLNPSYPLDSLRKRVFPQWMGDDYDLRTLTEVDIVA